MARCTSPVWISITNGSDKHKQSILFRKVIIQSYNTSSSATSSYTLQQEWMIPHEQDFPYTTSNWLKCQQSKKKKAIYHTKRSAQSGTFICSVKRTKPILCAVRVAIFCGGALPSCGQQSNSQGVSEVQYIYLFSDFSCYCCILWLICPMT